MTDGTTAGTRLVRNIDTNRIPAQTTDSSAPADLVVFQDRLWFSASDGKTGRELWVSDGTEAGTTQFADLYPGRFGISPTRLRVAGDLLYFVAGRKRRLVAHGRHGGWDVSHLSRRGAGPFVYAT
ncbi:MAG: ELWxxDGT repeat protein [Bifidobacterium adolescentis]